MSLHQGKIHFFNSPNNYLYRPGSDKEAQQVRDSKEFGWSNEGYRQAIINPDISQAIPVPEDFLPYLFRHISATIVGAGTWKATEFTEEVLKKARKLLEFKPAFVNHELETGNIIGATGKAVFTPAFKAKNGQLIAAGLDAPIWIDAKLHPDICRKLSAFPVPHIQSVSITVIYEWEPSHSFTDSSGNEDEWVFENRIGTIVDGKMVRRIVIKIIEIYETSLVWLGADPYAKILDENGDPINVEKSAIVGASQFESDPMVDRYKKHGTIFLADSCITKENSIDLSAKLVSSFGGTPSKIPVKVNQMDNVIKIYIAAQLGITEDEVSVAMLGEYSLTKKDQLKTLKDNAGKVTGLDIQVVDLEKERDTAKGQVTDYEAIIPHKELEALGKDVDLPKLVAMAKFGKTIFDEKRELCIKNYKLTLKDDEKEDEKVIDLINKADSDGLEVYMKQYGATVLEESKATCTACGNGDNITYRSSVSEGEGDDEGGSEGKTGGSVIPDMGGLGR